MSHLRWTGERPQLRRPILVLAFEGWNDAGDAASSATGHLAEHFVAQAFADIDPEPFYDFTETRPNVRLTADGGRRIDWPVNEFRVTTRGDANRDVIVLTGVEPQLKWRTFSQQIVALADALGVELVITLGALIADVAHSRPITVYGTSHDPTLCEQLDLEPSSYEGPTGIVGVVHHELQHHGIASMSLWAAVPSYVSHAPSPKATLALLERVGDVIRRPVVTSDLVTMADEYVSQIDALLEDDPDTRAYVRQIEEQYDASMDPDATADLISEVEDFLRDQ